MRYDVVIVGGGPAGLACAIEAAKRGHATILLERASQPPDKACGEGLMPAGLEWLESNGVRALIDKADCAPIEGICWITEDGKATKGRLPSPGGLGVRRTALVAAMAERARNLGAELRFGCAAISHTINDESVIIDTKDGEIRAALLIGADGLHSPIRHAANLDQPLPLPRRFGMRQHYQTAPWNSHVEVHMQSDIQAFVTPAGEKRVGIAFVWEADTLTETANFATFLSRFPTLAARVADAKSDSRPRGAGPFAQGCRSPIGHRLALLGDAAGYLDPCTGEGQSLAFVSAAALGKILTEALAHGATEEALTPYKKAYNKIFRRYVTLTRTMLFLTRRPKVRRPILFLLRHIPRAVDALMAVSLV